MENFLTFAYSFIPLVGMMGYVPQIKTLLLPETRGFSISLSTWFLWLATWIISLGYGVFCLEDFLFSLTSTMNIAGHILVISLVLYKRNKSQEVFAN